jgi:hypothetical protein
MIVFGCFQNICAGGIIYGWAGLSNILTASKADGGFGLSSQVTLHMFSVSSSCACVSQLFLGMIQDKYSPKICSILSNSLVAVGCFIFVASSRSETLIYAGAILIGIGGPGVQLSLFHLGNLFPDRENTIISFITGTINLSFIVFPLLTTIWENGNIGYQAMFQILGGVILVTVLISLWVWEDTTYEKLAIVTTETSSESANSEIDKDETDPSMAPVPRKLSDASFRDQITSGQVIRLGIFFIITSFWANYYIASISAELNVSNEFDDNTANTLIQEFSYISFAGVIFSPMAGYLIDSIGSFWANTITCFVGILQMMLLLLSNGEAQMIESFIMYNLFRSFLYPCFFSGLADTIGFKFYGVISGVVVAISGFMFLLFAPLVARFAIGACDEDSNGESERDCSFGNWNKVHMLQSFSLFILICMGVVYRKKDKEQLEGKESSRYGSFESAELTAVKHTIV